MKPIIYAIEDDNAIQELYAYSLENEFECRCFDDGDSFFNALIKKRMPDLILLDIMLPGENGFAILTRLKENNATSNIPVIMVSAKNEEISKVRGLNIGADDYISKPFGVMELIARIKANLRKSGKETVQNNTYKDIFIDNTKHQITINGLQIQTTLKEYTLLSFLCENHQKAQIRDVIFEKVWGDNYAGESRTLDIHIKMLRQKLAEAGSEVVIQTIRGVGYMLV